MTAVRCYLPLPPDRLAALRSEGRLTAAALPAFVVTSALRAADPDGDEEDWEHAALQQAAEHLRSAGRPVVVAAADLPSDRLGGAEGGTVDDLELERVASLHVGDDVVTGDPTTLPPEDSELELSWYDTSELDTVLGLVRALGA